MTGDNDVLVPGAYGEICAMNGPKAVLWDMDGTLVDSAELHWIACRNTMANEGIVITHEQFLSTFGQRNDSIIPFWVGSAATAEQIERIGQAKEQLYRDLVSRFGIAPEPGVVRWLARLHKHGWQQAIASAAPRANIDAVLGALSARNMFQGIVSAEDVHRGKPDPEVYLLGASRLDVPAEKCVVVEDAGAGIEGARRAGMRSIGVGQNSTDLHADVVVQSLELLEPDAFERLLNQTKPSSFDAESGLRQT
jgi:beta-phosphoglucomutase